MSNANSTSNATDLSQQPADLIIDGALPQSHWLQLAHEQLSTQLPQPDALKWLLNTTTICSKVDPLLTGRTAFEHAALSTIRPNLIGEFGLKIADEKFENNICTVCAALGHLVLGIDRAQLAPMPAVSVEQAKSFWSLLEPAANYHEIKLAVQTNGTAWLQANWLSELVIPTPQVAQNLDSEAFLSLKDNLAAKRWRKFCTEAQMILYTCAQNEIRQRDGQLLINTVLPIGFVAQVDTALPEVAMLPMTQLACVDLDHPKQIRLDSTLRAAAQLDPYAWASEWSRVHAEKILPLIALGKQNGKGAIIDLCAEQMIIRLVCRPSFLWKLWQKPNLMALFARSPN